MTDSPFNTMRVYICGGFKDVPLPDWYREAERIANKESLDWEDAISRALGVDSIPMTASGRARVQASLSTSKTRSAPLR